METPKIDLFTRVNGITKTCTIVCDMDFENSKDPEKGGGIYDTVYQGNCSTVNLEIEGPQQIVDQVMSLLSLKFSLRINFHGGVGYARFTQQKTLTPKNINIIHFRVSDIKIIENNGIVLDGAILHLTISPRILTSVRSWVRKLYVDSNYDTDDSDHDKDS